MNVLVMGARGFLGRNLIAHLQMRQGCAVTRFDAGNSAHDLRKALETADIVYYFAGADGPQIDEAGICETLRELRRRPVMVMCCSVDAAIANPDGAGQRRAEDAWRECAARGGAQIRIYRLNDVFGKWRRPNCQSAVATFCHNIAHDLPIRISEPSREIELIYVDDAVQALLAELPPHTGTNGQRVIPSFKLTLGDLAGRIQSFHDMRTNLLSPDFGVRFNQQLYATYLSYVRDEERRQHLEIESDQRGSLAEFIKSNHFGQIFISRTRTGATRGNHYHHTKAEKFFVVGGEGIIRMRQIESSEVLEYRVRGEDFQVIDIPPGYTHSIENIGSGDMVTLFWASEIFDPDRPDTYFLPVLAAAESPAPVTV